MIIFISKWVPDKRRSVIAYHAYLNLYNNEQLIIFYRNARMMTFQSLLKSISLKQLVSTLNNTHLESPLPYYVLKIGNNTLTIPDNVALSLRNITDETLARHNGPLSVWSPHHLNRIAETRGSQIQSRIILKNPYKSEALIRQALEKDIRQMVIDSFEELGRIESLKHQKPQFKNKAITYLWLTQDDPQNINSLVDLSPAVSGLFFPKELTRSMITVEQITKNILEKGIPIKQIICEGKTSDLKALREWQKREVICEDRLMRKTVDLVDVSEVDSCLLATRLPGKRLFICEEARQLIKGLEHSKSSLLVEYEQQHWLLSSLETLPMNQEKYLFHIECAKDGADDLNAPKAFAC